MTAGNPTTLEFAILGLLAIEPRSGYDLLHVFGTTAIGNYSSSPGAIYPALRRLEKRGLVKGVVDRTQTLRPRKTFGPTADGKAALKRWLRAHIGKDDVKRRLDELLLRFAFHSLLDSSASSRFLSNLAGKIDEYLAELEAQYRKFPSDAPPHGRMAFALGIENYRAAARWARRNIRLFQEESS
jgi:DNA-binding PadR family transcriptional regulator